MSVLNFTLLPGYFLNPRNNLLPPFVHHCPNSGFQDFSVQRLQHTLCWPGCHQPWSLLSISHTVTRATFQCVHLNVAFSWEILCDLLISSGFTHMAQLILQHLCGLFLCRLWAPATSHCTSFYPCCLSLQCSQLV